jgi:hypothetical protein
LFLWRPADCVVVVSRLFYKARYSYRVIHAVCEPLL